MIFQLGFGDVNKDGEVICSSESVLDLKAEFAFDIPDGLDF